jgi:2-dehydro-3-deoxygalactonokinase
MSDFPIIAVNWGGSNLAAYLVNADGAVADAFEAPAGVTRLDRAGMASAADALAERWPQAQARYAAGMIGSASGFAQAAYVACPAGLDDVAGALLHTHIGESAWAIAPGLKTQSDAGADILRGEEMEVFGLLAVRETLRAGVRRLVLPGTHTKWVELEEGRVRTFFTAMGGELYDRLSEKGLIAAIIEGEAVPGEVFDRAFAAAFAAPAGLSRLLFGVRAEVMLGRLARPEAASALRGVLLGAEFADALAQAPELAATGPIPLVGNEGFCRLYARAFAAIGAASEIIAPGEAAGPAFAALHRAAKAKASAP